MLIKTLKYACQLHGTAYLIILRARLLEAVQRRIVIILSEASVGLTFLRQLHCGVFAGVDAQGFSP